MKKLFTLLLAIGACCSCESDKDDFVKDEYWWYSDIYVLGGTRPVEVDKYKTVALSADHDEIEIELLSQGISKAELVSQTPGITFTLTPEWPSDALKVYDYLYLMDEAQGGFQKVARYSQTLVIRCQAGTPTNTQATLRLSTPYQKAESAELSILVIEEE